MDGDFNLIDIILERLLPRVLIFVDEIQTTLGILNADTRTTAVSIILGEVGIGTRKREVLGVGCWVLAYFQRDINTRVATTADTMFEGILDEGMKRRGAISS